LEALNLYLEEFGEFATQENIHLQLDFQQFFQYYRILNAKFLAQRIDMNESLLSQYVQGKRQPSAKQAQRILAGIHEIGKELSMLQFLNQ